MFRLAVSVLFASMAFPQDDPGPLYHSYVAHVAAANASLRLHETGEANRWLAAAPVEHRGWEWEMLSRRTDGAVSKIAPEGLSARGFNVRPDGGMIPAVVHDTSIAVIDVRNGTVVRTITGHTRTRKHPFVNSSGSEFVKY